MTTPEIIPMPARKRTVQEQRDYLVACLKVRRRLLGLTQGEVAARIGAKKPQVCGWERGRKTPKFASLLRWAMALDCELHIQPRMGR